MSRRAKSSPLVGRVERLDGGNPLLQPHIIAIPGISNPLAGAPAEVSGLKSKGKGKKQPDGQAEEIIETESLGSGKKKGTRKNAIVDLQTDMNRKKADKEETEKKGYEDDGEEKVEKVDKPKKEKKLKNEKRVKVGAEVQGDSSDPKHETSEPIEEPVHVTAKKKKRKREMEDVEVTTADAGAEPSPEEGVESMEAPQQSVKKRKPRSEKGELRRKLRAEALAVRVAAGEEVEADKQEGEINERGGQGPATSERTIKGAKTLREEAQIMRERLGLVDEKIEDNKKVAVEGDKPVGEAPAAPEGQGAGEGSAAKKGSSFQFGFSINSEVEAEMEARVARLTGQVPSGGGASTSGSAGAIRRVYVGGMPFSYDEDAIRTYWEYCGEIEPDGVDMMTFPDTGNFRGIVFITFKSPEGAAEALKYDGEDCDGRTLKVSLDHGKRKKTTEPRPAKKPQGPAQKTAGYNVLYVGNLAFEATPEEITEHFQGCNVTKVRIHTEKHTGKHKGYAHVHVDEASMDAAIKYNQTEFHGRRIKVMYAQPKKDDQTRTQND